MISRDIVQQFAQSLTAKGRLPATVESYARDAQGFIDYLNQHKIGLKQVSPDLLVAYQDYLTFDREEHSNSVRRSIIGIRQFFRHLSDSKVLSVTPLDATIIPPRDDSLGECLEPDDIERLLTIADQGLPAFKGARDAAMISLLCYDGIKANELIALEWGDLIRTDNYFTLNIKGARARTIVLCETSKAYLEDYDLHYTTLAKNELQKVPHMPIFIAYRGRDHVHLNSPMTRHGLKFIIYELGAKGGLPNLNSEQLRHFAIQRLILTGKSPEDIMSHLGLRRLGNVAKHMQNARRKAK